MRYDTLASFVYDENKGKIGSVPTEPILNEVFCNFTELGASKSQLIIGNLKDSTFVLRTIVRYDNKVTYIKVDGIAYNITKRVNYDKTSSFYLTERKGQK
ncbi:hypothetical protein CKN61_12760 [Carnobacterium divergens]|uniref:hypothetical protein n=1 Tax=Carnobacterium divergens TaxID=2748 RepID=UPI001073D7F9|nr:hypothetical protein [Carnobacterium divergens]MDT1996853.1 hypothetical protein [Carnobacterium divergens]TFI86911.1 hypothetical protein CKN61_12760 [Carnobacterium divergens]